MSPQAIAGALLPYVIGGLSAIGVSSTVIVASAAFIADALSYAVLTAGAYLLKSAFSPGQPKAPKPEDGKYNLKQPVPSLTYGLGRFKKGGDYDFLEEKKGTAYHILVHAAHHIRGYVEHWLHDEVVTLNPDGYVIQPSHFYPDDDHHIRIQTRRGDDASTAYQPVIESFPGIWTEDHRGDGLATVMMWVETVPSEDFQKVYPQGMPQHTAVIDGHDRLVDPRTGAAGFSKNLALFRYWHLTHPVGGKLSVDDLYTPDWAHAADVCDEAVTDRDGNSLPRYEGGMWFRAENSPVEIGATMDQAAELVLYETAEGLIGVHAGEFIEPDIRLTADDIISCNYDPNRGIANDVLAVRGRYTEPSNRYSTTDAAIYGNPYIGDDTERAKTVENVAVQHHNHMARLQKLAYIRAHAPRVQITAHFEPARNVPYRRFVRIHYPPKLNEAVIEITGRPVLSLRSLTYRFEGIVVPGALLYAFDAATEEGKPGGAVEIVGREDVPEPENFTATIETEVVSGGSTAAFALATFDHQDDNFAYELQWEPTSGGTPQSQTGDAGADEVRSLYLSDGVQYKLRARTWSFGKSSDWTDYQILTATADPVAPDAVTSPSATGGAGQVTFSWVAPNSSNYRAARLYLNTTNSMTGATLVATEFGAPGAADSHVVTGLTAGTLYGFIVATNASGVAAAGVGTGAITIT